MDDYASLAAYAYHHPPHHQQLPPPQPPPQQPPLQSSIHNLRTLFSLLTDDVFESEVEIERRRRYGHRHQRPDMRNNRKRAPAAPTTATALAAAYAENNNDDSDSNNNVTSPRARKRQKKNTASAAKTAAAVAAVPFFPQQHQQQATSPLHQPTMEFQNFHDYSQQQQHSSEEEEEAADAVAYDDDDDEAESHSIVPATRVPRRGKKSWDEFFMELEQFKVVHNHVHVTIYHKEHASMFFWLTNQRDQWKKHIKQQQCTLTEVQIQRMIDIGLGTAKEGPTDFRKANDAAAWNVQFLSLVKFKEANGHCNVTHGKDKNAPQYKLAMWLQSQRRCFQNRQHKAATGKRRFQERGSLSDERLEKLTSLGVSFEDPFDQRLQALAEYKKENGHTRVPTRYKGHNNLGKFVEYVKRLYRRKKLSPDKVAKLEAIGMDWGPPPINDVVK